MKPGAVARSAAPWLAAACVAAAAVVVCARPASGGGPVNDGVPAGAVAFFGAGARCPMGWAPADAVTGRMIVGVTEPTAIGRAVGTPLSDREDRTHTHAYRATVTLPARAVAGADGTNNQGAQAGDYAVMGTTAPAASGLGFVQLRACVKQ